MVGIATAATQAARDFVNQVGAANSQTFGYSGMGPLLDSNASNQMHAVVTHFVFEFFS